MTIAEIHGKLRPYECMEDLLTSDVFSALKYTHPSKALIQFLNSAISFSDLQSNPNIPNDIVSARYYFWPRSYREPDLILVLETESAAIICNIEAKYFSGKHNIDSDHQNKDTNNDFCGDQLVDQYNQAIKLDTYYSNIHATINSKPVRTILIYLTAHYAAPIEDIKETISKLHNNEDLSGNFYWLNWHKAYEYCINNGPILHDLAILLDYKGLSPLNLWNFTPLCLTTDWRLISPQDSYFTNINLSSNIANINHKQIHIYTTAKQGSATS